MHTLYLLNFPKTKKAEIPKLFGKKLLFELPLILINLYFSIGFIIMVESEFSLASKLSDKQISSVIVLSELL